jgi:hypothetical protein
LTYLIGVVDEAASHLEIDIAFEGFNRVRGIELHGGRQRDEERRSTSARQGLAHQPVARNGNEARLACAVVTFEGRMGIERFDLGRQLGEFVLAPDE